MLKWLKILWYRPVKYKGKYYRFVSKGKCCECVFTPLDDCGINNFTTPCYERNKNGRSMGYFKEVK